LCDRFINASFAYQGAGRAFNTGVLAQLESWVQHGRQPDLTLWFDLFPALAAARRAGPRAADRLESEDEGFCQRVQDGYRMRERTSGGRMVRLDAAEAKGSGLERVAWRGLHRGGPPNRGT